MSRLSGNLEILDKLREYFIENPDYRFWQGLWNIDIISGMLNESGTIVIDDKYHEESSETLKRVLDNYEHQHME